ncbi:unnamed protein product (mitochondrion) [Plasmodiophora brassicae]|uniref:Impact N-terminal domain-containing protein n=1 Tax=Plasmodiophora brassicae TaxID=37360 RepID=A0A3P3Y416_PLABS|nr:unnamed protein product [Plasmodiophora brassicae]
MGGSFESRRPFRRVVPGETAPRTVMSSEAFLEELEALQAIYGEEFTDLGGSRYAIRITDRVTLEFWSTEGLYPAVEPPSYRIVAMSTPSSCMTGDGAICNASVATDDDDHVDVVHGPVHVERRSRFIAHAARVTTRSQVDWVVRSLRYDSKLQTATHNIVAYRLRLHDGSLLENRDDDGEGGAGDCLLYLLQRMDLVNVVGVVSRWFGGVKLGPDRFRIISNVLKELIDSTEWRHGR